MRLLIILATLLLLISVGAWYVYDQLGGFQPMKTSLVPANDMVIAGVTYRGLYSSPELRKTAARFEKIKNNRDFGPLVMVESYDANFEEDSVELFIGLDASGIPQGAIPDTLEVRYFATDSVLKLMLQAHPLVRPSKAEVKERVKQVVDSLELNIYPFIIEKYAGEHRLEIMLPLKK